MVRQTGRNKMRAGGKEKAGQGAAVGKPRELIGFSFGAREKLSNISKTRTFHLYRLLVAVNGQ